MYTEKKTEEINENGPHFEENVSLYINRLAVDAKAASSKLAATPTSLKNAALEAAANVIISRSDEILRANEIDIKNAEAGGLSSALLDRLALTSERNQKMAAGLVEVSKLSDPVGEIETLRQQKSGFKVGKMRVPIGVINIIYESRPNVTADAAALCLKSGNASILRGGSEAINSNSLIAECMHQGLEQTGIDKKAIQLVATTDRAAVGELITLDKYIDMVIPRGGKGLIERIASHAKVPVLKHLDGICHVYLDDYADKEKAIKIAFNAKTFRYGICGAMETLLVAQSIAAEVLPELAKLFGDSGVELRGCEITKSLLPEIKVANENDWSTEYLGPILSVKVVQGLEQAIDHIGKYGSHHTDSIVTEKWAHAQRFLQQVDSSSVMLNTPTCFADGAEYGLGAEIGISTNKLHARGPVGLEGLTTQKYIVLGDGQLRT